MKCILLCSLLFASLGLVACGRDDPAQPSLQIGGHGVAFDQGDVTLRAGGRPSAVITAGGELRIGDTPVPLDAAQRQALLD
ncbi:YggN family protein, partial [Xanthomonas sp. Kuri4-1]